MDYKKHYDALISRAVARARFEGYAEYHHILPKCMGGSDDKSNLARLTAEEHYVAHQLLVKMHPEQSGLVFAAFAMSIDKRGGGRSNNRLYGWLRRKAAEETSKRLTGVPRSDETKAKLSVSMKSSEAIRMFHDSRIGIPRTDGVKEKLSEAHKTSPAAIAARQKMQAAKIGTKATPEARANMSAAQLKKPPVTDETRKRISEALKGKPKSAEHIARVSAALTGKSGTRLGKKNSEDHNAKIRAAAIGRKMSPESVAKMVANKTPEQRKAAALKAWETKRRNKEAQNGLQP